MNLFYFVSIENVIRETNHYFLARVIMQLCLTKQFKHYLKMPTHNALLFLPGILHCSPFTSTWPLYEIYNIVFVGIWFWLYVCNLCCSEDYLVIFWTQVSVSTSSYFLLAYLIFLPNTFSVILVTVFFHLILILVWIIGSHLQNHEIT